MILLKYVSGDDIYINHEIIETIKGNNDNYHKKEDYCQGKVSKS